jgi:hypothetical protein
MDICKVVDPPAFQMNGVTTYCHLHTEGPTLQGASVHRSWAEFHRPNPNLS